MVLPGDRKRVGNIHLIAILIPSTSMALTQNGYSEIDKHMVTGFQESKQKTRPCIPN